MIPNAKHTVAEFYGVAPHLLNNKEWLKKIIKAACNKYKIPLKTTSYQFQPYGISMISIVGASHIAFHTYPEAQQISIDVFFCEGNPESVINYFKEKMKPKKVKYAIITRGQELFVEQNSWYPFEEARGIKVLYEAEYVLFSKQTKYQKIDIVENPTLGRCLFLDGDLQIASTDEDDYNKVMTRPVNKNQKVLILGGGDKSIANYLVKHRITDDITIVEIDEEVIKACDIFFPREALKNAKRLKIKIENGFEYLKKTKTRYDVIIIDFTRKAIGIEARIFFNEFFSLVHKVLRRNGYICMQACAWREENLKQDILIALSRYFTDLKTIEKYIQSYVTKWVFISGRKKT